MAGKEKRGIIREVAGEGGTAPEKLLSSGAGGSLYAWVGGCEWGVLNL